MDVNPQIFGMLQRFCAYQERCEQDVRKKLSSVPCSQEQRDAVVEALKEQGFLDEERFVDAFVRGKLREQWGKFKIRMALVAKRVDPSVIDARLQEIDEEAYSQSVADVIGKWRRMHASDAGNKPKLIRFLLSRGFTMEEIRKVTNDK